MYTKALAALTLATTRVAAFSPIVSRTASVSSRMLSSTSLKASVTKLSQPAKDLLPDVDVFIFDCDGVIWRVRSCDAISFYYSVDCFSARQWNRSDFGLHLSTGVHITI